MSKSEAGRGRCRSEVSNATVMAYGNSTSLWRYTHCNQAEGQLIPPRGYHVGHLKANGLKDGVSK